jgi:putative two-component system response regulator
MSADACRAGPALIGGGHTRVLIVDDDVTIGQILERILTKAGVDEVVVESDSAMARRRHDAREFDAILLDLHMPEVDGFDLMRVFVEQIGNEAYAPILVLTGDHRVNIRRRALASGAKDFVQKPFEPTEVVARLRNLVDTARMHRQLTSFNEVLAAEVKEKTADAVAAKLEVLERLARAGEFRDDMTGRHAQRVGTLSGLLSRELGLDQDVAGDIETAAPLHDIGKIGVPDGILLKEGALTPGEMEVIRRHTVIGASILSGSGFSLLQTAESIALNHHEHWDGGGYPNGLSRDDIPVEGIITSVADAFDSLTNDRPYRGACSHEAAMEEILRWRGRQFAPHVVDALCRLYRRGVLKEIDERTDKRRNGARGPSNHPLRKDWAAVT